MRNTIIAALKLISKKEKNISAVHIIKENKECYEIGFKLDVYGVFFAQKVRFNKENIHILEDLLATSHTNNFIYNMLFREERDEIMKIHISMTI